MKRATRFWKWLIGLLVGLGIILLGLYLILNTERLDLDPDQAGDAPGEFIELSQGWVHYRLVGPSAGPVVVLVHGFSVPLYVWDRTTDSLAGAGYRVLSFDLYGRGYSSRPDVRYDTDLFVDQLEELVEALGIKSPFTLGGLSMGGQIAARYAHLHPDRIAGLILVAPEVSPTTSGDVFPLNLPGIGDYLMSAVMEPVVLPKLQAADFAHPENFPDWESKYRTQLQYHGTGRALLSTIRSLTTYDPREDFRLLDRTGLPVLLVWGEQDKTVGADQIAVLRQLLPGMEEVDVDQAGHLPQYERADLVNPELIAFLQGIDQQVDH